MSGLPREKEEKGKLRETSPSGYGVKPNPPHPHHYVEYTGEHENQKDLRNKKEGIAREKSPNLIDLCVSYYSSTQNARANEPFTQSALY
jgi:hypothetical protein